MVATTDEGAEVHSETGISFTSATACFVCVVPKLVWFHSAAFQLSMITVYRDDRRRRFDDRRRDDRDRDRRDDRRGPGPRYGRPDLRSEIEFRRQRRSPLARRSRTRSRSRDRTRRSPLLRRSRTRSPIRPRSPGPRSKSPGLRVRSKSPGGRPKSPGLKPRSRSRSRSRTPPPFRARSLSRSPFRGESARQCSLSSLWLFSTRLLLKCVFGSAPSTLTAAAGRRSRSRSRSFDSRGSTPIQDHGDKDYRYGADVSSQPPSLSSIVNIPPHTESYRPRPPPRPRCRDFDGKFQRGEREQEKQC